jgi:hypothetical protein
MKTEKINIYCQGEKIYSDLSEESMFEALDQLTEEFYATGVPHPEDIMVEYTSTTGD